MTATLDIKELRAALETKQNAIEAVTNAFNVTDGGEVVVTPEMRDDLLKNVQEAKNIKAIIEGITENEGVREWAQKPVGEPFSAQDAQERAAARGERKSLADHFMASNLFAEGKSAQRPSFTVEIDGGILDVSTKDVYGGGQTPTGSSLSIPGLGGAENVGITESRMRQKHIRDLFPKATTTASVLYGVRETGYTNNAAQVNVRNTGNTDFTTKPHSDIALAPVSYPVGLIAHWIKAHKTILDDEPRLRDFLNRRMVDGVMLAEDREILFATGGAEQITGIMNTPGVQAYTGLNTDALSGQIRRAATRSMLAEYEPNGLVVSVLDWEALELEKVPLTGQYRIAVNIAVGGEKRLWSMDIVPTTAMTQGKFLLGSFGLGAQLYDREKVNVIVSTEDDKNIQQNLVTIRAEERLALEVSRPEAWVVGSFTTPS